MSTRGGRLDLLVAAAVASVLLVVNSSASAEQGGIAATYEDERAAAAAAAADVASEPSASTVVHDGNERRQRQRQQQSCPSGSEVPANEGGDVMNRATKYGVDVSFPSLSIDDFYAAADTASADGQQRSSSSPSFVRGYEEFLGGCMKWMADGPNTNTRAQGKACLRSESDRVDYIHTGIESIKRYTGLGYKKVGGAPSELVEALAAFWAERSHRGNAGGGGDGIPAEDWGDHYMRRYCNNWVNETGYVDIGDGLRSLAVAHTQPLIEEWLGVRVRPTLVYGLRVYRGGNVFATHVDPVNLIVSAEITVAQDVDEDWPFELMAYDGSDDIYRATNVTIRPGEMVLIENAAMIHGRPFPLKGRYYVSLFVNFEPVEPPNPHATSSIGGAAASAATLYQPWEPNFAEVFGGKVVHFTGFPAYLIPDSKEAVAWKFAQVSYIEMKQKRRGRKKQERRRRKSNGRSVAVSNGSQSSIEINWVQPDTGEFVFIDEVLPGTERSFGSSVGHRFVAREKSVHSKGSGACNTEDKQKKCREAFFTVSEDDGNQIFRVTDELELERIDTNIEAFQEPELTSSSFLPITPTLPLRPLAFTASTGYPLYYLLPPRQREEGLGEVRGILVYLHGCGHGGHDFFLMPEERLVVAESFRRNYLAVVSLESSDRDSGCWSDDDEALWVGGEGGGVDVISEWTKSVGLSADLPRFGMGVSSGASILFTAHKTLNLKSVASYIVYGGQVDSKDVEDQEDLPPTVFVHMPRDEVTAQHVAFYLSAMRSSGVPVEEYTVTPNPFDVSRCVSRLPELGKKRCQKWVDHLVHSHPELLDPSSFEVKVGHEDERWLEAWREIESYLLGAGNSYKDVYHTTRYLGSEVDGRWAVVPELTFRSTPWVWASVIEEIGVCYARHKMTADHLNAVLDFLMSHA